MRVSGRSGHMRRKRNGLGEKTVRRILPTMVLTVAAGSVLLGGESGAQIILATGPDAEIIGEGHHREEKSVMDNAWVRPDLDLSGYARIFFLSPVVRFREVPERRYTARTMESATEFPVSDAMQTRLRDAFGETFYEAVQDAESYELSDEVGRDVLLVRGFLTDVASGVPPELPGSNVGSVRWAWESTMVIELRDSMSDDVLARVAARERVEGPFEKGAVSALTPRMVQDWSRLLVRRLEELSDLSRE